VDSPAQKTNLSSDELVALLFSYMPKIAAENNLDILLMEMGELGRQMVLADRCTLWIIDHEADELKTVVAQGIGEIRMPLGEGFVGWCISNQKLVHVVDAYDDARFNREIDQRTGYRTRSVLVIPIYDNAGEIMGAYQAINKLNGKEFTVEDSNRLSLTAVYSAKALETARLFAEIEDSQKEIIFRVGEISESRSRETGNHVKRVSLYCSELARLYGLSERECELIKLASPMHDVGKVAIPDSILKKPGKLTDEEFAEMKNHAQIGYDVFKNSKRPLLRMVASIAWTHQEKFNGSGYPRGLMGQEIPIEGRICAVADVFDALVSDRCYKKAWPMDEVVALFEKEKGEHFDPEIVDLLLNNLYIFESIRLRYDDAPYLVN
jgi:HD-GYP domain-containing protein (c-di-GMP phosphodiesterase class II)